ncbi:hypothetical protein [carnivorous sponge associated iridovirus]|jgi:hypothetical protein|nr:hypothetical protein [carnivorous sponge associated iridovirus]
MYYKDSPYGQASYPQQAFYGGGQHAAHRDPLIPHGYDGYSSSNDMYGGVIMETIKGYFTNPWVIVIAVILVVIVIAWLMSGKKEGYRHY